MALNAELTVRLDAESLIQSFLGALSGPAGSLGSIQAPADAGQLASASSAGGSFARGPIAEAIGRFGGLELPGLDLPATIQRIETSLAAIEQFTARDSGADLAALAEQLRVELERANSEGIPGTILQIAALLGGSPTGSSLGQILSTFAGGIEGLDLPEALGEYLPAFASTVRLIAGLMVYETVLAEGERMSQILATLFSADRARGDVEALVASFQFGTAPLATALGATNPGDLPRVDAMIAAVERAAAQLEEVDAYVSRGMGFGEATLIHFSFPTVQAQVALAGALLRNPDLAPLRRVTESLARQAQPVIDRLDPGGAAARGLDQLLDLAEGQVGQAAAAIRALDAGVLVDPLTTGLSALTAPLRDFTGVVARIVTEVRAGLEQVRSMVASLPIDDLATAIRSALEPVTRALQALQQLVDEVRAALEAAAQAALGALADVEQTVDRFQQEITAFFADARAFIDGLHLEQTVSAISEKVNEFVGVLRQAQMKPYFDAASSAIGTAADVIAEVPLDLLPESMKADLDAALAPVREVDPEAVEAEIEGLLQIGADGEFELRAALEESLAAIQAKFDALIATLDEHHPAQYLERLDQELSALATKIQAIAPDLTLEPVQQAIAQLKSALGSFDLARELQPVQAVFDRAIAALDEHSPAQLLQPLEARVADARQRLEAAIRIAEWRPTLDGLAARAVAQLDVLDPAALEQLLTTLVERLKEEVDHFDLGFGNWLGMIVTGLMRGSELRLSASSVEAVLGWIGGTGSASSELSARASRLAAGISSARHEVEAFDPAVLSTAAVAAEAIRAAATTLAGNLEAASEGRLRLEAARNRLDVAGTSGRLAANRTRYLQLLVSADALGGAIGRSGLSEADVAIGQLRGALAPLQPLVAKVQQLGALLGVNTASSGFSAVIREVLRVAPPARIAGLVSTLVAALRDRLKTLLDQVLAPVRAAIDDLQALIDLFSLQPAIDGIEAVFQEVRTQLLAYSPAVLLGDQLAAFGALKQQLLAFDPLAPVLAVLNGLRDTAARIVGKLSARTLLESPLAIYDTIVNALRQLDIQALLGPVLDGLDEIAEQVDRGLDETVEAFKRLQESLPPPGGGSSASISISVT